jgi:hypothetical protein
VIKIPPELKNETVFLYLSIFFPTQVPDKMMHCETLTVNNVHWLLNKSQGSGAPGRNNTNGQQKPRLLDKVFLDFFE